MKSTKKTERQTLIDYFVEHGIGFEHPTHGTIDLLIYLAKDIQHGKPPKFEEQRAYIEEIIQAGRGSEVVKKLFNDIQKAVKVAKVNGQTKDQDL